MSNSQNFAHFADASKMEGAKSPTRPVRGDSSPRSRQHQPTLADKGEK